MNDRWTFLFVYRRTVIFNDISSASNKNTTCHPTTPLHEVSCNYNYSVAVANNIKERCPLGRGGEQKKESFVLIYG